jgi:hypothetical protein
MRYYILSTDMQTGLYYNLLAKNPKKFVIIMVYIEYTPYFLTN